MRARESPSCWSPIHELLNILLNYPELGTARSRMTRRICRANEWIGKFVGNRSVALLPAAEAAAVASGIKNITVPVFPIPVHRQLNLLFLCIDFVESFECRHS